MSKEDAENLNNVNGRFMPSIFVECNELKQAYDNCFTNFFQQYISPNYQHNKAKNPCEELHKKYKQCLDKNLTLHKPYDIDLDKLREEVLLSVSEGKNDK